MNDGQYTNLRNYLEEIASNSKQLLEAQKRMNELLEKQGKRWTELPVDADGYVIGKAVADETGQQTFTPKVTVVPPDAVGPVTVETVEVVDNLPELTAAKTPEQIAAVKERWRPSTPPVTPVATPDPTFDVPPVVVDEPLAFSGVTGEVTSTRGSAAPWPDFDQLSVGQIISRVRKGPDDAAMRARILAYERANRNRDGVIKPLVNWNS